MQFSTKPMSDNSLSNIWTGQPVCPSSTRYLERAGSGVFV